MAMDSFVSHFADTLATMAKEEVTMLLGAEDALRQLEENVRALSGVLQDAERRAFTDAAVRRWLAGLKDVVYDADDIIDYSRTHTEKLARLSSEHPVLCYSPMLSFFRRVALRHRTGNRIRRVNERVQEITKEQSRLNLIAAAAPQDDHDHDRGSSSWSRIRRLTDPILFESHIVGSGIENDTSDLVGLLTREEEQELGGPRRIPIVAITGMGGVGKTTLAQKIHNHETIKDSFREPPPMWVCVSQQYTDENIFRVIIRCAGGGDPGRDESFVKLRQRLASVIEGKKFFLILDDVWEARVWEDLLQNPLQRCAVGSRVLITTRQQRVARQMGARHLHLVHPLSVEESWSLLCKLVGFQEGGGIGDGEEVGEIGRQIAEKCGGLPLAIKTIAGVLMTKSRTRREWEKVLKDPAWSLEELPHGVMGDLYLSYQDLPSHLKQCFLFCSLFPEDHVFERDTLTRLWVAEGFIADSEECGDLLLEDVANDYYNELLSRSFLQPIDPEHEGCKMHDLLRSLAQFLARDEYRDVSQFVNATKTPSSSSSSSMKLRHLLIIDTTIDAVTQVVKENESLRTLLLYDGIQYAEDTTRFLFNKLGCLRVIDFSLSGVKNLPKSVGNLIHLRYLNLSWSSFVELPETVGNLSNLQYLSLNNCSCLKKLPSGIEKLQKLRFLDLEDTPMYGLPEGIQRLQHLNCLKGFVANEEQKNKDGGWCSLKKLELLSRLRTLTILNLERELCNPRGQPRAILKHLHHLTHLNLRCSTYNQPDGDDEKYKIQLIFEIELFPPPSLITFKIYGYFGLEFPSCLTNLPNLTTLELWDCKYCKQFPELGQLPNLYFLRIRRASSVERIGPEFMAMGVGYLAFPKLTTLIIEDMYKLVDWQWEAEDGVVAMPCLEVLNIERCPKLRSLPGGLGSVTTLTTLSIQDDDSLSVIENLHSLKVLHVWRNNNLTRISNLPALQAMKVHKCNSLREVEGLYSLQSLDILEDQMESLPRWLLLKQGQPAFPMLKSLSIHVGYNDQVLHRCLVNGPDWPKIQHYPQVDITQGFNPPLFVHYTKDPFTFTANLEADGSAGDGGVTSDPEN